jgi:hypothetical protein
MIYFKVQITLNDRYRVVKAEILNSLSKFPDKPFGNSYVIHNGVVATILTDFDGYIVESSSWIKKTEDGESCDVARLSYEDKNGNKAYQNVISHFIDRQFNIPKPTWIDALRDYKEVVDSTIVKATELGIKFNKTKEFEQTILDSKQQSKMLYFLSENM